MKLTSILSHGLVPMIPINTLSNLERIVVTRAIGSSLISTITSEWSIDKIVIDIFNIQSNNVWVLSVAFIYLYGYYKLTQMMNPRLDNMRVYDRWSKRIEDIMFILFLVFTRDVQNAI